MSTKYKPRLRLKLTFLNRNPLTVEKTDKNRTQNKAYTRESARISSKQLGLFSLALKTKRDRGMHHWAGLHIPACKTPRPHHWTAFPGMQGARVSWPDYASRHALCRQQVGDRRGLESLSSGFCLRPFSSSSASGARHCRPGLPLKRQKFPTRYLSPGSTRTQTAPRLGRAGWRPANSVCFNQWRPSSRPVTMTTQAARGGTSSPLGRIFLEGSRRRKRKWHVEAPVSKMPQILESSPQ